MTFFNLLSFKKRMKVQEKKGQKRDSVCVFTQFHIKNYWSISIIVTFYFFLNKNSSLKKISKICKCFSFFFFRSEKKIYIFLFLFFFFFKKKREEKFVQNTVYFLLFFSIFHDRHQKKSYSKVKSFFFTVRFMSFLHLNDQT